MELGFEGLQTRAIHRLMSRIVIPRPIAWVVSDNGEDQEEGSRWNLAPFSYFNAVSADPPLVMISLNRSRREDDAAPGVKDTLSNLTVRPEHTIVVPSFEHLEAVHLSSSTVSPGVSEFAVAGVEPSAWDWPVPMPAGVRAAMGCTFERLIPIGDGPHGIVLSRVRRIWLDDAIAEQGPDGQVVVDSLGLDPLMRIGGSDYASLGRVDRPEAPLAG